MNNKDLKLEQQPNNELKDDGLPEAIACTKPLVVRRCVSCVSTGYKENNSCLKWKQNFCKDDRL
jgi:hypothetical protein